jgi:hypothetical protein
MWELWLTTLGNSGANTKLVPIKKKLPPKYPHCQIAFKKDAFWEGDESAPPRWLPCAFPDQGVSFSPKGALGLLWDFSLPSPNIDQSEQIKNKKDLFGNYTPPVNKEVHRWYEAGWVEPTWFWENSPKDPNDRDFTALVPHTELFRLVAASRHLILKRPGFQEHEMISTSACVTYPYAILLGLPQLIDIEKRGSTFHISCSSCRLTNCLDSFAYDYAAIIVKRPPYVLLPVDIGDEPWFDDSAIQTFRYATDLIRAKRFVAAIILGISALIAIITSFAVATTALVKEMQTATFVNNLHRNITLALSEQRIIDLKLEARLNALEEVVLELGQDVANLKTRMSTRCHANYDFICVTPLPYNASES